MRADEIIVARDSVELGIFPVDDAVSLLRAGLLQPTDCYRHDRADEWRRLSELDSNRSAGDAASAKAASIVAAAGRGAGAMLGKLARLTHRRCETLGLGRLLEDYLPRIRESVSATLAKSAGSIGGAVRDEAFLRRLFGAAYDSLPKAVQRFVNEPQFIEFCMKHRSALLRKTD